MTSQSLLDRRPIVVALAGPNGAGKSTFFHANLTKTGLYFVNADVIALSLGIQAYAAAKMADTLRLQLVEQRESFIFETVFSDPVGEKLEFLIETERSGYTVLLIFIGIPDAGVSEQRVAMRASRGGHDVPADKLLQRFPRTVNNLKQALKVLSNVWVYDHADLDRGYRLIAKLEGGNGIKLFEPIPGWFNTLLP